MQLRRSPGGSILKSRRRRPLEPPSSLTATTAVIDNTATAGAATAATLSFNDGRFSRPMFLPSASAAAVRSTWRSWRMLPGQAQSISRRSASALSVAPLPASVSSTP